MKIIKEIDPSGTIKYLNENWDYHQPNGPAYISKDSKYKSWWINGQRHRLDGPAIERRDGTKSWYLNGNKIPVSSQEEFERYLKLMAFI